MEEQLRLPPQNIDAERGVLGSMMLMEQAAEYAVSQLNESDFYVQANGILFRAVKDLLNKKIPCDSITLCDHLVFLGEFEEVGGVAYVMEIIECVPHAEHIRYYTDIVLKASCRRRLLYLSTQLKSDIFDPTIETEKIIAHVGTQLDDLMAERSSDLQSTRELLQQMRESHAKPQRPMMTGLPELDEMMTGGPRPCQLTVIAARPSIGKTALVAQIMESISKQEYPTLLFTLEMTSVEIFERFAKQGPRRGEEIAELGMFIEGRCRTLDEIMNCIRLAKRRQRIKAVAIDYVQKIKLRQTMQTHERLEIVMDELKWAAKEYEIAMIPLAQLNRSAEKRDSKRPELGDMKGGGAIEQEADVAMLIHRPEFYDPDESPGVAEIIFAKNRNGSTGTVKVGYIKEKTLFVPYANRPIDVSCYDADGKGPF